jgi:hypothetical protein
VITLLDFLTLASKFNFLLQFFDKSLEKVLFQLTFPLLSADDLELEDYQDNGDHFLTTA